jgi:glycerol-3-phosphate dehydrogenase
MDKTSVVIIGGGCTGTGILWDLSLRGIPAVLFEQKDLANGATGRCHGLLHSGGRYSVKDVAAANECVKENVILKRIAASCIEDTGGYFVHYNQDDPEYVKNWVAGSKAAGIPIEEVSPREALDAEPLLPKDIKVAYVAPDAHVNVFLLTVANAQAAIERGARLKTYTEITSIELNGRKVEGVHYRDILTGEQGYLGCEVIINAAGPWADKVASLAGISVPMRCDRGALVIVNHRLSTRVINRCRKPGDGDVIVPGGPVSILGTTSVTVSGPEDLAVKPGEIEYLLGLGSELIPAMAEARVIRSFCGTRPLYTPKAAANAGGREISRNYALLDHKELDGLEGFISIVGGKLTTYRLMAETTTDLVCRKLDIHETCSTDRVPLRPTASDRVLAKARKKLSSPAVAKAHRRMGKDLALVVEAIEKDPYLADIVCDCELVSRAELNTVLDDSAAVPVRTLTDVSRRTRLGFGPCQGTFCGYKAMLAGYQARKWSADEACKQLEEFLEVRWRGEQFVPPGKQDEQTDLSRNLYEVSLALGKSRE